MRKLLLLSLLLLALSSELYPFVFKFNIKEKLPYNEETTIIQQIYKNGKRLFWPRVKTVLNAKIDSIVKKEINYTGSIRYFKETSESAYEYKANRNIEFSRNRYGKIKPYSGHTYISRRGLPLFINNNIRKNETWTANSVDLINLRPLDRPGKITIPSSVKYKYINDVNQDGSILAKISYSYKTSGLFWINKDYSGYQNLVRVEARVSGIILWDKKIGMPYKYDEQFNYHLLFADGQTILNKGRALKIFQVFTKQYREKEKLLENIRKHLGGKHNLKVTKRGVVLNLGRILFDTGKSIIRLNAIKHLIKVAKFLNKHKNINIHIDGHTDNVGGYHLNMRLSRRRAQSVYKFFVLQAELKRLKTTFKGWGPARPIADNSSKEGRQKNRRVEITFLLKP
ncbi:MAG: OmpA family protein [Spirochaetes bacterium]|nr:OmpA family protein [Spirochaetota bacterium]